MSLYIYDHYDTEKVCAITNNDLFFDKVTASKLDDRAVRMVSEIDDADLFLDRGRVRKRNVPASEGLLMDISTGCKTVLNVMYNPRLCFSTIECGTNALWKIIRMNEGRIIYYPRPFHGELLHCNIIYRNKHYTNLSSLFLALRENR